MHVSHETIYRSVFVQARGALKRIDCASPTASTHAAQQERDESGADAWTHRRCRVDCERPPCIEDRAIPGHWEGDLLAGGENTHIATLVERTSRYVHLVRVTGKDSTTVVNTLVREVQLLPTGLMPPSRGIADLRSRNTFASRSRPTWPCTSAIHKGRGNAGPTRTPTAYSANTFPTGPTWSTYTQRALNRIAQQLNTRPRKTLGFRTPAAILAEAVALTR